MASINEKDATYTKYQMNKNHAEKEKLRRKQKQVFDQRTCNILSKFVSKGLISEIKGCIRSCRVANVFYAHREEGVEMAIKIYTMKTSILEDKDMHSDQMYRFGYRKNSRKMVYKWAEREMSNLLKIYTVGIRCPKPIVVKDNVLIMSFIGKKGLPAPLLKNANLSREQYCKLYIKCISIMRDLYHKCKLIHGDLNECNLLYMNEEMFVIGVSQSVESDHPHAINFLMKDCTNITEYFCRKNVTVMTIQQLFNFITTAYIADEDIVKYITERNKENLANEIKKNKKFDLKGFKNAYILKWLDEVTDVEEKTSKDDRLATELTSTLNLNCDNSTDTDFEVDENQKCTNLLQPYYESSNCKEDKNTYLKETNCDNYKTNFHKSIKTIFKKRIEKLEFKRNST